MSKNIVNKINVNGKEYEVQSKFEADGKGNVLGITVGSGLDTSIEGDRLKINLNLNNLVTNENDRSAYIAGSSSSSMSESDLRKELDDVYLTSSFFSAGAGISLENGSLEFNKISINPYTFRGIKKTGDYSCEINVGSGIKLESACDGTGDSIQLNLGDGLEFNSQSGSLTVSLGDGLKFSPRDGSLAVSVGESLQITADNQIALGTYAIVLGTLPTHVGNAREDGRIVNLCLGEGITIGSGDIIALNFHTDDFYLDSDGKVRLKK